MRKAFDTNVPKLKPRLRSAMVVVSDTTPETQDENTDHTIEQAISEAVTTAPDKVLNPDSANTSEPGSAADDFYNEATDEDTSAGISPEIRKDAHINFPQEQENIARNIVPFPNSKLTKEEETVNNEKCPELYSQQTEETPLNGKSTDSKITEAVCNDIADKQVQPSESLKSVAIEAQTGMQDTVHGRTTTSQAGPELIFDEGEARRKRLENVKRKVGEAVRPEIHIEPVPEDPALAVESVLCLVNDLEARLFRSREDEKALRIELAEAKAELTRTVDDGRTASGRLVQAEAQLGEKRKVLEEMLFEMGALEQERDQAVRMVQMLTAKDKQQQLEFVDLKSSYAEMQRALDESKTEEERLADELDDRMAENARLHVLLSEITKERDSLARNVEQLRSERDELTEAKKALEKVHHALSQARARLRE
jgi:chromosome segregation ATPase